MFNRFLLLPLLVLCVLPVQAQNSSFNFQQFDVPNSASTEPDNINARGDIVGFFFDQAGKQQGFFSARANLPNSIFPAPAAPRLQDSTIAATS